LRHPGRDVLADQYGTNLAEDIESGFFNRLALTPLRRVSLIAGLLVGVAALGALQSAIYMLLASSRALICMPASAARW